MLRTVVGSLVALTVSMCGAAAFAATGKTVVPWSSAPVAAAGQFAHFHVKLAEPPRFVTTFRFSGQLHRLILGLLPSGDFCSALTGPYGGSSCPTPTVPRSRHLLRSFGFVGDAAGPIAVSASFQSPQVARVVVSFHDGTSTDVPFVWVTKPIGAGFAYVGIPKANRRAGHRPAYLLLFGLKNQLLRRASVSPS